MFDLSAMSSTEVLLPQPEVYPASEWTTQPPELSNGRAQRECSLLLIRLSCTSNVSVRAIHSISCRMSGVSPMLRIGVAEAMEKKRCYEAEYGLVRGALLRGFSVCRMCSSG